MRQYSFILREDGMCAAGLTAYESPATNQGTFQDVYCKNEHKKNLKKKKSHKRIDIPNPMK